jgi:hypothetical protein
MRSAREDAQGGPHESGTRGRLIGTLGSMDDLVALVDAFDAAQPRKRPGRKPKPS